MKRRVVEDFGERLSRIRKSRGMTQAELGQAAGVSNRVIAYYEKESPQPPGAMLVDLARALSVSTDQLLGLKPMKETSTPKAARLLKRLQKVEDLSASDQRAVLKFIDALLERGKVSRRSTNSKSKQSKRRLSEKAANQD
jgi:transcriptional regulator with XRE-family HTH domain